MEIELSLNEAAHNSHAVMTRALENPPAWAARSAIPPSTLALSSFDFFGGSDVAAYCYYYLVMIIKTKIR